MENVILNNGVAMPKVGLGTWNLPTANIERIIGDAYELGYRKLDCAWSYGNEAAIGNVMKELRIPREDMFITSKLHIKDIKVGLYKYGLMIPKKSIRKAVDEACGRFHTDYLDLYLLHWPWNGYLHMWEELIKLKEEGRIRAIGGTSFMPYHIRQIKKELNLLPDLNQVEYHPYGADLRLVEYCKQHGIAFESFSSFGAGPTTGHVAGSVLADPIIVDLANKYNKNTGQVILRWITQQGISVIPRSSSKKHLADNINIFDFELENEDMERINQLNENRINWANPWNTVPNSERNKY